MIKEYTKKNGDVCYMVQITDGNTKRGIKTRKEAERIEKQFKKKAKENRRENKKAELIMPKYEKTYFKEVVNSFLSQQYDKAQSTQEKIRRNIEMYILPHFQDEFIEDISKKDFLAFRKKVNDYDFCNSHKNDILNLLKRICKHYNMLHDTSINNYEVMGKFKTSKETRERREKKEESVWTRDEFNAFLSEVHQEKYKIFFELIFNTGLRLGEVQALTWNDLNDQMLTIKKAYNKQENQVKTPKTATSYRTIYLDTATYTKLLSFKEEEMKIPTFSEKWFIFGRKSCYSRTNITKIKDKAIKKAGVKRITFHSFRHTHASWLIENQVPLAEVSKRLGHANPEITLETYTHVINKKESVLNNFLEKSIKN